MAADQETEALIQEKEEEMVAFLGSNQPINRKGWFLKPISDSLDPSEFPSFSSNYKCLQFPKFHFNGWVCLLRNWDQWVKKLKPIYKDLWKKVGIFDAINASTYKFRRDPSSIFGVARFWCGETNTFIFPWGEATITLEDVMILGGFPVLGEPVRAHEELDGELGELEAQMTAKVKIFNQTKCKKADISVWMRHFMEEGNGDEVEHIAFLALWLSRFVLIVPHARRTIGYHVLPIAIRLARGTKLALAPAVLASLYRDLRKMKGYLANDRMAITPLITFAPLHLLQLWIWERFTSLRPESSNFVSSNEPRAARWHDTGGKMEYSKVRPVVTSRDEFHWRPYAASLDHWCRPSYYRDDGVWVCNSDVFDEGLESFARCLRASELVGIDCIEQYLPHRVARQFGFDQDVPRFVPCTDSTWEAAWENFDVCMKSFKLYVPSRLFKSDVTLKYSNWWDSARRLLKKKIEQKKKKRTLSLRSFNEENAQDADDTPLSILQSCKKETAQDIDDIPLSILQSCKKETAQDIGDIPLSVMRSCQKEKVQDIDDMPLSYFRHGKKKKMLDIDDIPHSSLRRCKMKKERYNDKSNQNISSNHNCENPPDLSVNATAIENHDVIENTKIYDDLIPSFESPEATKLDADALNHVKVQNVPITSKPLDIEGNGVVGHIEETSGADSVNDPIVIDELEENFKIDGAKERTEDRWSDIVKLKEEIALIHARVKELESLAEEATAFQF